MDQAEYLDRVICNQQIQCVIDLDGTLDDARLQRALQLVMDAEPVLGCRFVEGPLAPRWERRAGLRGVELCSVEECEEACLEEKTHDFLKVPGDPRTDPLVRVKVIRAKTDRVCVKIDHIVADTGGAKDCLHMICEAYSDSGRFEQTAPPRQGDRGLGQVLGKFTLREKMLSLRNGNPRTPAWGFPFRGKGAGDWAFAIRRLSPEEFGALRDFGRARGATVNDCILAAYYRAFFGASDTAPGTRCTIRVPIDLRRYADGERAAAVCNLTGQMYPSLERVAGESFGATVDRTRECMDALKERSPGIGAAIVVAGFMLPHVYLVSKVYARMVAKEARDGRCDPYLSNMGVLSGERLEFGDVAVLDGYFVSPLQWAPGFLMGASTFKDRLTLTVGYGDARENSPLVEEFLDLVALDLKLKTE